MEDDVRLARDVSSHGFSRSLQFIAEAARTRISKKNTSEGDIAASVRQLVAMPTLSRADRMAASRLADFIGAQVGQASHSLPWSELVRASDQLSREAMMTMLRQYSYHG